MSPEELLVVLNTLGTPSIPGLQADTWIGLTSEQQDLTLSVACRALEARGLAQFDQGGQLRVHRALLTAVGVCAFPQRTALIDYLPPGGMPRRLFAHTLGDDSVVHTADGGVHALVLVSSEEALVDELAAACQWSNAPVTSPLELTVPRAAFTQACDAAAGGADAEARQLLQGGAGAEDAASALAATLASGPRISIVQMLQPYATPALQDQSFTVIDGGKQTWMVAPLTNASDSPLRARTVSRGEITTTLLRGL